MKKKVILSFVAVLMTAVFAVVSVSVGRDLDEKLRAENHQTVYAQERADEEWKMVEKGTADSDTLRKELEEIPVETDDCEKKVRETLEFVLEHFSELEKMDETDIQIAADLAYAMSFNYYLVLYSDYDQTIFTEKEKTLKQCLVNEYIDVAFEYSLAVTSNTQEKADLFEAKRLGRKLSKNLDEEVDIFVEALAAVVEEGTS